MSQETQEWLNRHTLIGFTEKRGQAWHYRQDLQSDESNHYVGAIPVEDVRRRLLSWDAQVAPMFVGFTNADGEMEYTKQNDRLAVVRSDNQDVLGVFKDGYQIHQYGEWLIDAVANIVDDSNLQIGQAGLLKKGAVCWVSIELPVNMEVGDTGLTVRPQLLATTSHNGSLATTHKLTNTIVVCDNTLAMGLSDGLTSHKTRHSKNSSFKLATVRDALQIVHQMGDLVSAELQRMIEVSVTDKEFQDVVSRLVPIGEEGTNEGARTKMGNKQDALWNLWQNDARVSPWRNTGFGVVQSFNTYSHHISGTDRGRAQRNTANSILGKTAQQDEEVIRALELVLAR